MANCSKMLAVAIVILGLTLFVMIGIVFKLHQAQVQDRAMIKQLIKVQRL